MGEDLLRSDLRFDLQEKIQESDVKRSERIKEGA